MRPSSGLCCIFLSLQGLIKRDIDFIRQLMHGWWDGEMTQTVIPLAPSVRQTQRMEKLLHRPLFGLTCHSVWAHIHTHTHTHVVSVTFRAHHVAVVTVEYSHFSGGFTAFLTAAGGMIAGIAIGQTHAYNTEVNTVEFLSL